MVMALNALVAVHTKTTLETTKQITHFFKLQHVTSIRSNRIKKKRNDSPYIFGCILHLITRVTKKSRWIFSLGPKSNTPIIAMPPENGTIHVECSIMVNVMSSATEAELVGLFENCQKVTYTRTALA